MFLRFMLVVLIGRCVLGKFVVETNSLKVTYPGEINGSYECAIGNFGVPRYGGSITGNVVYPQSNQLACSEFDDNNATFIFGKPKKFPLFLLADRGDCHFIMKTWNAQLSGAAAILVTDDRNEELITMDSPDNDTNDTLLLPNITIPSVLITKSLGDMIKKSLSGNQTVKVILDWIEALPHPDERVEYEFWMNSNNECGPKCKTQMDFVKNFRGAAQILDIQGYTRFNPHYITWFCPEDATSTIQCKSQCINRGRYCAPDPEGDLTIGYEGKNVVTENLRQACFFRVANQTGKPWLWWDYAADFAIRCPMKENKYNKACADQIIQSLGVDVKKIDECIGDTEADVENPILISEQEAQIGEGTRGDITILPTLIINNRQYRGNLDRGAVLKAICAGFKESTDPSICLAADMETNECLVNNGGCWQDNVANVTACKDTFRGRVCECPTVQGVKFIGDGYTYCKASGPLRCSFENGGCWKEIRNNSFYSACFEDKTKGCECPSGFNGDGVNSCEDVDECKEKLACQCPGCKCKNTWGSYQCTCSTGLLYMKEHDKCIATVDGRSSWSIFWIVVLVLVAAGAAGYLIYKYRIRRYMDAEIRGIMAQYMPLDDHEAHEVLTPAHTHTHTQRG